MNGNEQKSQKNYQSQMAYEALKEMIAKQELLPGQQVVETTFAEALGISRTPMREAIRLLSKDGLVEIIPYKGSYIKNFNKTDVIMGFEVAEALEGMAAFLMAERVQRNDLDEEHILAMDSLVDEMDEHFANQNFKAWGFCDEAFHDMMTDLSGNVLLIEAVKKIRDQLNCVLWFVTPASIDKQVSNEGHKKMIQAIRDGDTIRARSEAQAHRHRVRDDMLKLL